MRREEGMGWPGPIALWKFRGLLPEVVSSTFRTLSHIHIDPVIEPTQPVSSYQSIECPIPQYILNLLWDNSEEFEDSRLSNVYV